DLSHNVVPTRVLENPRGYTISGMSVISFLRRIYRKSQKNLDASVELAEWFFAGKVVAKDAAEGAKLLQKAAGNGSLLARVRLADRHLGHHRARDLPLDVPEAIRLLESVLADGRTDFSTLAIKKQSAWYLMSIYKGFNGMAPLTYQNLQKGGEMDRLSKNLRDRLKAIYDPNEDDGAAFLM
ncbi:MAG: hypothetical protein M0Z99_14225, partial [Betaproteobacteria bacterium]|nr:hypothetical protein [Betaproteobacteria bacterium]